jgi:hypothetical protein
MKFRSNFSSIPAEDPEKEEESGIRIRVLLLEYHHKIKWRENFFQLMPAVWLLATTDKEIQVEIYKSTFFGTLPL